MQSRHQWVNCRSWSKGSKPSKYWQLIIGILRKCIMTPSPQTLFAAHPLGSNFRISLLIYIFSNAQTTVWPTHLPRAVQRLGQALTDASKIHSGFRGSYCLQVLHIPASAMHVWRPSPVCSKNLVLVLFLVLACVSVGTGDQNQSAAELNDEPLPSRNEYAACLILLHFLLDWTFACPETWIRHFMHKVLI